MKLLLFDIDLTLINSGGAGRQAMTQAFEELFGSTNGFETISFAGRTDVAIFKEGLTHCGSEWTSGKQSKFKKRYLDYLKIEIEKPNSRKHILPGVPDLLSALNERNDVTLALLTGNWRDGAKIKLEHFNLFRFFEFGAFADDSEFREELPFKAAEKFSEKTGNIISPSDVFVIGDTPRDVACAGPFGARTIAVSTGFFSHEELKATHPNFLFEDFTHIEEFFKAIN